MRIKYLTILFCAWTILILSCSKETENKTQEYYDQKLLEQAIDSAVACSEASVLNDVDSILIDEYNIKEKSLFDAIKSYIPNMRKVRDAEGAFPGIAVNLYSLGYDKESKVFHLNIDASYLYNIVEKYPPVGITEIEGESVLIRELLNLSIDPSFFVKTGRQIWLKNISKTDHELEDDRFPIWNYCYDLKSKTGIYYYSGSECVLNP